MVVESLSSSRASAAGNSLSCSRESTDDGVVAGSAVVRSRAAEEVGMEVEAEVGGGEGGVGGGSSLATGARYGLFFLSCSCFCFRLCAL